MSLYIQVRTRTYELNTNFEWKKKKIYKIHKIFSIEPWVGKITSYASYTSLSTCLLNCVYWKALIPGTARWRHSTLTTSRKQRALLYLRFCAKFQAKFSFIVALLQKQMNCVNQQVNILCRTCSQQTRYSEHEISAQMCPAKFAAQICEQLAFYFCNN